MDDLIILEIPEEFASVGDWYSQFEQIDDLEVCRLLEAYDGTERSLRPDQPDTSAILRKPPMVGSGSPRHAVETV